MYFYYKIYDFFSKILTVTKTTSNYIAGLQDPFQDKYMNGKSNYKVNHYKSMYFHFVHSHYESQDKCILREVL